MHWLGTDTAEGPDTLGRALSVPPSCGPSAAVRKGAGLVDVQLPAPGPRAPHLAGSERCGRPGVWARHLQPSPSFVAPSNVEGQVTWAAPPTVPEPGTEPA